MKPQVHASKPQVHASKPQVHASKRFTTLVAMFALVCMVSANAFAGPGDKDKKAETEALAALAKSEAAAIDAGTWKLFSDNLVQALRSKHDGVKLSAMQLVIRYGDQVEVDEAVFDVVRLYRNHQDDDVRRMAVVALGKMQNPWAMDMLVRSERFEKSEAILQTIRAILAEYRAAQVDA